MISPLSNSFQADESEEKIVVESDEQRRWTRVFVRKDGRWQLVHSQGTTIKKP